ncbi:MAG: hypothetical protein ABIJ97_06925 [Bacteroidota bacterium]
MKFFNLKNISQNKDNIIILLIIIFSFILYGNTINNGYSLDDEYVTYNNTQIKQGIKAIPEIFSGYYSTIGNQRYGYRPIVKATYAIEYSLFGENPHISHLINILIYIFLCVLLFKLLKRILKGYNFYLNVFILFLFIAHPIHTEVVASLKNRDELLCLTGLMLTVLMFFRYADNQKVKFLLWGCFFYLFSLMSKTNSLTFLVIIPLTLYYFTNLTPKRLVSILVLLIAVFVLFYVIEKLVIIDPLRDKQLYENPFLENKSIVNRFSMLFSSLFFYLRKLIYPHPLLFYYGYNTLPILKLTNPAIIFSFVFHAGIFVYSIITFKKKTMLSYSILFYLISISMFTNFIRPVMGIVGERLVFISSLGFIIAVSYLIFKLFKIPNLLKSNIKKNRGFRAVIILIIILIPYSAKTISRNYNWKSHLSLYENDIKHLENSAKANDLYATALFNLVLQQGLYEGKTPQEQAYLMDKIIEHYNQSLKIYYNNNLIHNSLGTIYLNLRPDLKLAKIHLIKATSLDSSFAKAFYNLGEVYKNQNIIDSALYCYQRAVAIDSFYTDALSELSKVTNRLGNFDEAVRLNGKIIELEPQSDKPYINLGNFYFLKGDTLSGLKYAEKAVELNPQNYVLMQKIGELYQMLNNQEKSLFYIQKAKYTKDALMEYLNRSRK